MNKLGLKNALNNLYADRVSQVDARTIAIYGKGSWSEIRDALREWQESGAIEIVRDPETATATDPCVELKGFIE